MLNRRNLLAAAISLGAAALITAAAPGLAARSRPVVGVRISSLTVAPVRPGALAVAPRGGLYIADDARDQILERLPGGRFVVVAGNGKHGFSGDGGRAVDARLNSAAGMAVAGDGSLYFADSANNRVRKVSPGGLITTVAGDGGEGWTPDGSPARDAPILSPQAVTIGPRGLLYLAASGSGEVLRVERNGTLTRIAGVRRYAGVYGIGHPATHASVDGANGLAFDPAGNLYLAGFNTKTLLMIDRAGIMRVPVGTAGFYPRGSGGIVATRNGNVLAINTQAIVEVTPHRLHTLYSFSGHRIAGITGLLPAAIAVAATGAIYTDSAAGNGWSNGSAVVVLTTGRPPRALWRR